MATINQKIEGWLAEVMPTLERKVQEQPGFAMAVPMIKALALPKLDEILAREPDDLDRQLAVLIGFLEQLHSDDWEPGQPAAPPDEPPFLAVFA